MLDPQNHSVLELRQSGVMLHFEPLFAVQLHRNVPAFATTL